MIEPLKFYLPLYRMNYFYFFGVSLEDVKKYCKDVLKYEYVGDDIRAKCDHITNGDQNICLIYLKNPVDFIGFSHEAIHAANFTLEDVGIEISTSNDEALTYLHDLILEEGFKLANHQPCTNSCCH